MSDAGVVLQKLAGAFSASRRVGHNLPAKTERQLIGCLISAQLRHRRRRPICTVIETKLLASASIAL